MGSLFLIIIHFIIFFYYSLWAYKRSVLSTFLFFAIFILLVTCLAESNRSPFDFSEGESELVSGFNTEFRSTSLHLPTDVDHQARIRRMRPTHCPQKMLLSYISFITILFSTCYSCCLTQISSLCFIQTFQICTSCILNR